MAFETKEELLEKYIKLEKPHCPDCNAQMTLWEVPPINFSDGLGWGTPYLFVCFNDECPSYKKGWDHMQETMETQASYRCFIEPGQKNFEYMPVFSPMGATGGVLDDETLIREEARKELIKQTFSILTDYYLSKDWDEILKISLDPKIPPKARLKAIEMVGDIGESEATEHLINHKFPTPILQQEVEKAVEKLHARHYTRECPYCAEIIKQRAKVCRHCDKALS
ncbi:MAG: zinc ribbon domain-containing protein [Proteobacteria bacterium]|nr:zinc ribbon domain-containing protein [Pseudomonadota bacterium]MBU1387574.1 zinc ribbon domain-containing protein [Pseudomonadota bacterium]MBU1544049.1 zinc ribbon domain-containing protein [Pseudomonadota bacterium]MBU2479791.1 zinc ribbon domain-containing protein [Pseudomonadota bacterium]